MSYKFVIKGSELFYLEKDKLSDNMGNEGNFFTAGIYFTR
jgi:hypothetical protein